MIGLATEGVRTLFPIFATTGLDEDGFAGVASWALDGLVGTYGRSPDRHCIVRPKLEFVGISA
jgi:hypothetical protein